MDEAEFYIFFNANKRLDTCLEYYYKHFKTLVELDKEYPELKKFCEEGGDWKLNRTAIFSATTLAQASWVLGTLVGGLCGSVVTDVKPLGLDYAISAMFLALLIPQCTDRLHTITAVLAAFFSVALHLAGLHQWNVVLATILAATMGTLLARRAKPGEAA